MHFSTVRVPINLGEQVGTIDVDSTSRSALRNSKSAALSPAAAVTPTNSAGRRHLAQVSGQLTPR